MDTYFLKIVFILFLANYNYSQNTDYENLKELTDRFEEKLLFSAENSKSVLQKIDTIILRNNSKEFEAISQYVKALKFYKIEKDIDSATIYAKQAYKNHIFLKDSVFQFKDINLLYKCFLVKNKRDSAFAYATKELELSKLIKNPRNKVTANLDMGDVYYLTRQHDKVRLYRNKALLIAEENNLKKELSDIHLKIAQSHLRLSKQRTQKVLDSAIYHGKRALQNAKQAQYDYGIYKSTVVLADFLNINKQPKEALNLIETVIGLPKSKTPLDYVFTAPFYYAVILKDNKKYDEAKKITKELLQSTKPENYSRKKSLNFFLSVLYAFNKQPDSTDYAIKQAIIANNAQSEARLNDNISRLQTQYETKEKEQEIKNLEQNKRIAELEINELQRQRLILGYSLLIPILFIITGSWYMNRRRLKLRLEAEQKGHAAKMSELKALRSQMNPHFIFNAMNSVQSLIIKDKKDEAYNYLTKLSQLIRKTLTSSDKSMVYLDDELDQLVNYLELEKLRFKQDFVYHVKIDESIDQVKIPSMIIQPFVENAVKHGLLHKEGMKRLDIDFHSKANLLHCVVEDNGVGRKASQEINNLKPDYQTSFSTNAIQKRFELYQQYSDKPIGFEYEDLYNNEEPSGTRVTISIPFITDDN
jgi:hypothetical protein